MRKTLAIVLALSFLAAPAAADRLGGAWRGGPVDSGPWLGNPPPPRPGPGSVRRVDDVLAYWPFFFEHEKESLLAETIRERRSRRRAPPRSSPALFVQSDAPAGAVRPITAEQRRAILPLLVGALADESPRVRDAAALALGKVGGEQVVAPLAERLEDPDPEVRQDVLLALGLTGERAAFPWLMDRLLGGSPDERVCAALGLALSGVREVVPALLHELEGVLEGREHEVRACSLILALGVLGDEAIVSDLGKVLSGEETRRKVFACQALGRIGGKKAAGLLEAALADRDRAVRAAAALAFGDLPGETAYSSLRLTGLKSGHRMTKVFTIHALARIAGERSRRTPPYRVIATELREIACEIQKDKYLAMHAALALGLLRETGVNSVFAELLTPEQRTKFVTEAHTAMAMALGLSGDRSAVGDLREIVRSRAFSDDYRGYAAFALGLLDDAGSKATILEVIRQQTDREDLLRSACWAVALLGGPEDAPTLIEVLRLQGADAHPARGAAAIALGILGDATTLEALAEIVEGDDDGTTRAFAIAAIGCLLDREPGARLPRLFRSLNYRELPPLVREILTNL